MLTCDADCMACNLEMYLNKDWHLRLEQEFRKNYFASIITKLHSTKTIFPPLDKVFAFAAYFTIHETRIVILGQDPYHGYQQANGLAFSVNRNCKIPPSLMIIFKELRFKKWVCGDLTPWAKQGVLLLNNSLTVFAGEPNSHKNYGWDRFVDEILKLVNNECENVVFMLWGQNAWSKERMIDVKKHCILKAVHPRSINAHKEFLGCNHFNLANAYLEEKRRDRINWML